MQSTIHNPSQLNQFEAHFRGVTDAVESESIPEVACCRTLVQRSYSTHSVVIPKNPVLIADAHRFKHPHSQRGNTPAEGVFPLMIRRLP